MHRVLILISLVLVVFNAECFAACTLEPCAETAHQQAAAQPEAPCHHQDPTPSQQPEATPCSHPQFVNEDGARFVMPILDFHEFELAPVLVTDAPVLVSVVLPAVLSPPPPLHSSSLSRAILRV